MPNQRISQLAEKAYIANTDLLAVVEDPTGTPITKKLAIHKLASGLWAAPTADFTLGAVGTAQAVLPAAQDTLTVEALTTYFFDACFDLTTGATSHTTAVLFAGTATITSIGYRSVAWSAVDLALGAAQVKNNRVATAMVVAAASTAVSTTIMLSGIVRINAGGTFIPQIQFSVNPTGTNLTKVGSYFRMFPAGASSLQSIGAWA